MRLIAVFLLIASSLFANDVDEDRLYAVAVAGLRPSTLHWKTGDFGRFVPTERIYARVVNLCRLGDDTHNYFSGLFTRNDPLDAMPIEAGAVITAHGKLSVLAYVTESDVAHIKNGKRTYLRMLATLMRDVPVSHIQARATGPKACSPITPIIPGAYGAIILAAEGQGYECDIVRVNDVGTYVATSLGPKAALTSEGTANQWVHHWFGRVQLMLPISSDAGWGLRVYSAATGYEGFGNARVALLPSDWDQDEK